MRDVQWYYVYIMASRSRILYIGMTNDLARRVEQHRSHALPGFTSRYRCERLVFFERFSTPSHAIAREKALKGWLGLRKIALIEHGNPSWADLSENWGKPITLFQEMNRSTFVSEETADPSLRSG